MARLPTSEALGPRPQPSASRDVVSYDGGAVARATVGIGQVIAQVGEQLEKKNDEQAVFEARRKLDEWERSTLYDPEKGVVAKRGVDALSLPGKVTADYDKFAGQIAGTLSSSRQRQVFQDMAQSRRNQVADFTVRHATQQKEVYERGQVNADMAASGDRAVLLASNGDTMGAKAELDVASGRLASFMRARGMSGEEIAGAVKENSSKTHAAVIQALVNNGDPTGAKAYLDNNGAAMLEADKIRVNGVLKEGVLRAKAQAFGDEAMSSDMDLKTALATARERFTGDEEVAATNEIKTRFAEKEAVKAQAVKQVSTDAWSALMERGSMSAIPPATMQLLRTTAPEEERQMRDWLEAKYRRAKADAEGTGNEETPERVRTFIGLMDMAANEPGKFAELDLTRYAPLLTKPHRDRLITIRAGIDKNDAKAQDVAKLTQSTMTYLNQSLAAAGVKLSGKRTEKQIAEADMFKNRLFQDLDIAAQSGKLDSTTARAIGARLLQTGIEQGSGRWFSGPTKKRGFEQEPGKTYVSKQFSDIPPEDRRGIVESLAKIRPLTRSIYGDRDYVLSDEDKAEVERRYQIGIERGIIKQ